VKRLFVDTGAWYAVVDKKDPDHKEAEHFLTSNKIPLLTTNFIFDETITLIRSRLGWSIAKDFGQRLKDSRFVSIVAVKDEDAYATARKLATSEGVFGGTTSGANVWAAIQRARIIGPGKKIVTVICDSGLKYLEGDLYK